MSTPWVGFGGSTLQALPEVKAGYDVRCPHCGADHALKCGTLRHGDSSDLLLFYTCAQTGGFSYLAAIRGRLLIGKAPDVKETV